MASDDTKATVKKGGKRKRLICILIAAGVVVIAAAVGLGVYFSRDKGYKPFEFDTAALEGRIKTMSDAEIQEELNRIVEEGMFNISIASNIVFLTPGGEGEARIENIAANPYHMQVSITLDATGETLYRSKGLAPGTYIEHIRLNRTLEPGEYDATATFFAITRDKYELVGTAGAKIKLTILDLVPAPTPSPAPGG